MSKTSSSNEPIPIIIVGGRGDGHAGVIQNCILDLGEYWIVGVYDSALHGQMKESLGAPLFGKPSDIPRAGDECRHAFVAIGHNPARVSIGSGLIDKGYELVALIHPAAYVSRRAKIGVGVYIGPGAIVQTGCSIGDHVIINSGAIVDHDCRIHAGVHIAPNACLAGRVTVKEQSFVGIGAEVVPDVVIGRNVMVGAGAVVLESTSDNVLVAGVPAATKKAWLWPDAVLPGPEEVVGAKPSNIYVSSSCNPSDNGVSPRVSLGRRTGD